MVLIVMALSSYADVEPAAGAEQATIGACGLGDGYIFGREGEAGDSCRAVVLEALVLRARALVAQGELQAFAAGLEAGILQRALELGRVTAQHVEGGGALDNEMGRDIALLVDV